MSESNRFLSIREEQQTELEIMKALHDYCSRHNLRYVLGYGTLLGAIRHKGFIPWDNDMDILMPRGDMDELLALTAEKPVSPDIRLFFFTTDAGYHYPIIRACSMKTVAQPPYLREGIDSLGLWVDIFPMDGVYRGKYILQKPLIWFCHTLLNATIYILPSEARLKRFLQKVILKVFPDRNHRFERWLTAVCRWGRYDQADKVCDLCEYGTTARNAMDRADVENPVLASYEDARFFIPRNAGRYLEALYGNYMQLPPEEDRITHSICSCFKAGGKESL